MIELYLHIRNGLIIGSQADKDTVQQFGLENKQLYGSVVILFLSSLFLYHFFLLLDLHLWKLCMEDKPNSILVDMAVEDFVGDGNDTKVGEIAGDGTKRIFFGEFRAEVPMVSVVTSLMDILIE